jgi:hypothetical protein
MRGDGFFGFSKNKRNTNPILTTLQAAMPERKEKHKFVRFAAVYIWRLSS